jgi:acetoin utilization deacetylase AcuC-like enzyme
MSQRIAVVEDTRFREHRTPSGHPERPERLGAVSEALARHEPALARLAPRAADDAELLRIHRPGHLALVTESARRAPCAFDADTWASAESAEVARLAAGSAIEVVRAVARGEARAGFAALRPPGHHAEASRPMGFCLYNNAAVAARALQADERVGRILLLDWDVHHGNGTQHSFEEDRDVLYVSTHQFPFYPGTGDFREAGRGAGAGTTLNVPMPAGCGDAEYTGVFQRLLMPAARAFRPEFILVSCGFDAHRDDPLASMELTRDGFLAMARTVRALADELCGGRLACVLEGGYAASGLRDGTSALLEALTEPAAPPVGVPDAPPGSTLRQLVDRVVAVHGARIPGLGAA